jgi:hypothetical protein
MQTTDISAASAAGGGQLPVFSHTPLPLVRDDVRSAWLGGWYNGIAIGLVLGAGAIVVVLKMLGKL